MARLKAAPRTAEFTELRREGHELGDRNDCAVIAVAAATGVPYKAAHEALRLAGRKAKRGTPMLATEEALAALGFNLKAWTIPQQLKKVLEYGPGFRNSSITTHHPHRFHQHRKGEGTLLFRTKAHILCIKDGVNHDWSHRNSLRVISIYQVTRIADTHPDNMNSTVCKMAGRAI